MVLGLTLVVAEPRGIEAVLCKINLDMKLIDCVRWIIGIVPETVPLSVALAARAKKGESTRDHDPCASRLT